MRKMVTGGIVINLTTLPICKLCSRLECYRNKSIGVEDNTKLKIQSRNVVNIVNLLRSHLVINVKTYIKI